jgi:PAS domain S-box-containing protein
LDENREGFNQSVQIFKKFFQVHPTPIYVWQKTESDLVLINYNDVADTIVHGKMKKFLGIKASEFYKDRLDIFEDLNRCFNEKLTLRRKLKYKYLTTKQEKFLEVIYVFVPPDIVIVHTDDITEQKKTNLAYSSLVDNSLQGLVIMKPFQIVFANKAFAKISGYTVEELLKLSPRKIMALVHPEDQKLVWGNLKARMEGDRVPPNYEFRGITKDGKMKWLEIYAVPIEFEGTPAIQGTFLDITERKQAENKFMHAHSELNQILNASLPLCVIDRNFNIIKINDTFASLFRIKKEEKMSKKCYEIWQGSLCNTSKCIMDELLAGKDKIESEITLKMNDGIDINCIVTAFPYRNLDNEIIGIIESFTDITKRKKIEQKLKESEAKYREAYDLSNLYKDLFAHDMNNILQGILSSNQLANIYFTSKENSEITNEMFGMIDRQIMRGAKLISNVQKLSQLEETQISLQSMEFLPILNNIREKILDSYQDKNINIEINNPYENITIQANELLLDVFENILNNAVRHNNKPIIEILIKISKTQKNKISYWKIEFMDNGRGIPDAMKKKIFLRGFQQVKDVYGIGLGLSLVKKIIESYNGHMWIEDRIQGDHSKGCNFILLIPQSE